MTETVITVQGRHVARHDPERAVVSLVVAFDGPARDAVFAKANAASEVLRAELERLHDADAGPVRLGSSDSVQVWGERPWNNEGRQLAMVFHARIGFTAEFDDFDALSRFLEPQATVDGVTIGGVQWTLTDERTDAVTAEVRTLAVADAVEKATAYASA